MLVGQGSEVSDSMQEPCFRTRVVHNRNGKEEDNWKYTERLL